MVQDFQQAAVIVGSGSVRECLFRGQAGIPIVSLADISFEVSVPRAGGNPSKRGINIAM